MFTGIIENLGEVVAIAPRGTNVDFWIKSSLVNELKIDQSVAHQGVCLTVVEFNNDDCYRVTAVQETLDKTNLSEWKIGSIVNLERSMQLGERIDGHMVYGHVDAVGECVAVVDHQGSWVFTVAFDENFKNLIVEKGSVSFNGTSLTVFDVSSNRFSVAIIPYTYQHTSIKNITIGSKINLEFDIFGKYIEKYFNR
jgi:riboflavin synthase